MFLLDDLKQSRIYQDAREEGRENEAKALLKKMLSKRFGKLSDIYVQHIDNLTLAQLEDLAEAWLDFENISDLDRWLANLS
jgi:predicted transposase YdaD